jgi:hypothetical protein
MLQDILSMNPYCYVSSRHNLQKNISEIHLSATLMPSSRFALFQVQPYSTFLLRIVYHEFILNNFKMILLGLFIIINATYYYHDHHPYIGHKLRGLSARANYTDRATAACRRSYCQLLRIEGCRMVSAADPLRP